MPAAVIQFIQRMLGISLLALTTTAGSGNAQPARDWTFSGQVEPRQTVEVANQVNGVVKKIHVVAGQRVRRGALLVSLDDADAKIEVAVARAALEEANARLELAVDVARRQRQLLASGTGREALATERSLEATVAKAVAKQTEARLAAAELTLTRTRVKAPIDGTIGRLRVATGAFVEAEGGTVLLELVQLDPVLVSYSVPYNVRQEAMARADVSTVAELLKRLRLSIQLPGGQKYPDGGRALFESARLEANTKALRVWGEFPNPDRILVPGLPVRLRSRLLDDKEVGTQ